MSTHMIFIFVGMPGNCLFWNGLTGLLSPSYWLGKEGLMPKIVSGVSGGSIVAGFLAIHTDEEKLNSF